MPSSTNMDRNIQVKMPWAHQDGLCIDRYKAISFDNICGYPNVMPPKIRDKIPKFSGEKSESANEYLQEFVDVIGEYEIDFEDVVMRLFVQSLKGDERDWFSFLPIASIHCWNELKDAFLEQFGSRINPSVARRSFMEISKDIDELVPTFNLRFSKVVREIPEYIRPNDAKCLVVYLATFDKKMSFLLRDKELVTLQQAYQEDVNIENNLKYSIMRRPTITSVASSSNAQTIQLGQLEITSVH